MTFTCRSPVGFEELMSLIQYLTLRSSPHLGEREPRKNLSWSMSVLTDGIGKIHDPVPLRHAAIKIANNIANYVRRPTFDRNQNGRLYLEKR
jgi:hypothetical protein